MQDSSYEVIYRMNRMAEAIELKPLADTPDDLRTY